MRTKLASWVGSVFLSLALPAGAFAQAPEQGQGPAPQGQTPAPQGQAPPPQGQAPPPQGQAAGRQDQVAALKQSLQENQARLRQYEWIETTIVSKKGEEKSRTQKSCYYGADGKLQKVPVAAPEEKQGGGAPGRPIGKIVAKKAEKKKEELAEYMQQAAQLVQRYIPPDPNLIQKSKEAGKISITPTPGASTKLELHDYLQAGDLLAMELDPASKRLLGVKVASYLETPEDPVALDVRFASLNDGTSYAGETTLDAPAEEIRVTIQNSGYRKMAQ